MKDHDTGEKTEVESLYCEQVKRADCDNDNLEWEPVQIRSDFWEPLNHEMRQMINRIAESVEWTESKYSVIVFGEIFGSGVQDMAYGLVNGKTSYRVFDIAINGKYLDWTDVKSLCDAYGIDTVPVLYQGPFSKQILEEMTDGETTVCSKDVAGNFKGREGVVVKPVKERVSPRLGRVILKSVSADYLARKGGTEDH
jgi:RNA ligase (TIGR02306 family)